MGIQVYEKPGCRPCWATKRQLDQEGIEYTPVSLLEVTETQLDEWRAQGLFEAPIVVTPTETWSGYRPDKIKALTATGR